MLELIRSHLYPYLRQEKLKVLGIVLFSLALAMIGGAQVALVRPLIDSGLDKNSSFEEALLLALQLLGLGLLNFPCRFFHFYWLRNLVDKVTVEIRNDLFKKLSGLPTLYYARQKQGDLISQVVNDSQLFAGGIKACVDLIREPLKAMVFLGMAFYADWQLTLVIFVIAPFLVLIFSFSGKRVKTYQNQVQTEQGNLTHVLAEGLAASKLIKAFGLESFIQKRFKGRLNEFFKAQKQTTFVEELAHPLVELVGAMAFAGVIVFAHHRIQSLAMTTGEFMSFVAALALFMDPIRKFSQGNVRLSQARAALNRLNDIQSTPQEQDPGPGILKEFHSQISVENLSFSYGEGDIIQGLDLEIKKGQKVALVGLSGSGKSTLINLLLGLYQIEKGDIKIDGLSLKEMTLQSLRSRFALVSQDIFLFNDTIKNNLCLNGEYTDEEIHKALEVAYALEFVKKLPDGINTIVGDRGLRLSGGQQQRITIARAYLRNADIYLFDEATSALDNESERVVQKALENIAGHKTVITVAHRLSTIMNFDQIYVLKAGRVIESGNHEHLMKIAGEYSKLYKLSQV